MKIGIDKIRICDVESDSMAVGKLVFPAFCNHMDLRVEVVLRTESYLVFVNGLRGLISRWYQCIRRRREIAPDFG